MEVVEGSIVDEVVELERVEVVSVKTLVVDPGDEPGDIIRVVGSISSSSQGGSGPHVAVSGIVLIVM